MPAASFACFLLCNAYDQPRMSAFPHLNVKAVGSHAGISIGEDGPSQMAIEDVSLACPSRVRCARARGRGRHPGGEGDDGQRRSGLPAGRRPKAPVVYEREEDCPFLVGQAAWLRDGDDLTIVANGLMVAAALQAYDTLAERGSRPASWTWPRSSPWTRRRSKPPR